jgi:hypothetical protein
MKKPNVSGVLGALAVGEQEAEARQKARTTKATAGGKAPVGRPRTDRKQFTITLSPTAVGIVEQELLARMQDKNLRPAEKRPGPTIEALILMAAASRLDRK